MCAIYRLASKRASPNVFKSSPFRSVAAAATTTAAVSASHAYSSSSFSAGDAVPMFSPQVLRKYTPIKLLGSGSFGYVYSCRVVGKEQGPTVAVKILPRKKSPFGWLEAELLAAVDHVNVVKFIELIETGDAYNLVMEELRGPELFKLLVERDAPFDEDRVLGYVEQMLGAIEACHRKNFAHVDIKIENCVFREPDLSSPLVRFVGGATAAWLGLAGRA
jgi:serine/threonine protein kinase